MAYGLMAPKTPPVTASPKGSLFANEDGFTNTSKVSRKAQTISSNVGLDGNIGCLINGAGLGMATMDMIQHAGGEPANFLDIGGGASAERVATSIELVLSDQNVEAILINIFAGINRCDWVAQGIVDFLSKNKIDIPLVVRLSGTNVDKGQKILKDSGKQVSTADTLADAANKVVAAWKSQQKIKGAP